MSATAVMTTTVRCPNCGGRREMSRRQRRRISNGGGEFTCPVCRSLAEPIVTDEMREYWLDRYPLEWIRDVATGIWGTA